MKHIFLTITILIISCDVFAQEARTHHSIDKCGQLFIESKYDEAIPSLLYYKDSTENSDIFDEQLYTTIMMMLTYYYSSFDPAVSNSIIYEALNTLNAKSPIFNSELRRQLIVTLGKNQYILKNYEDALNYYFYAKSLYDDANDKNVSYQVLLSNIMIACMDKGDLLMAKMFMDEFLELYEHQNGDIFQSSNPMDLIFINNYGSLCSNLKKYDFAERCFKMVIKNGVNQSYIAQDAYALAYLNLLSIYFLQDKWKEIDILLGSSGFVLGNNMEINRQLLQSMTAFYLLTDEQTKADSCVQILNQLSKKSIYKIATGFSESERENYWIQLSSSQLRTNNSVAYKTKSHAAISEAFNIALFYKNLGLNLHNIIRQSIAESDNDYTKQLFNTYKSQRTQLSYKTTRSSERDSLLSALSSTERELMQSIDNLEELINRDAITWIDVKGSLNKNEAIVDFCIVPIYNKKKKKSTDFFGAYILGYDYTEPKFVLLTQCAEIDSLLSGIDSSLSQINNIYSYTQSRKIYDKIWNPVLKLLKGCKTIYYSPTQSLARINFNSIYTNKRVLLGNKTNLVRLSSIGLLPSLKKSQKGLPKSAALYGDINYFASIDEMIANSSSYPTYSGTAINNMLSMRSMGERRGWRRLINTKIEIENIAKLLNDKHVKTILFEGSEANEESIKSYSGNSPEILHIATHGFVINTPDQAAKNYNYIKTTSIYSDKEAFMMWTGLLMAGANNLWLGGTISEMTEDGILTADEISRLDLDNTKLVVLSACETARGREDPVDGVLGLQRAFKMAGVEAMLLSLWRVDDFATQLLMTEFYNNYLSGCSKQESLVKAQKYVREFKDEEGNTIYSDPYYWAAFVLIDAIE